MSQRVRAALAALRQAGDNLALAVRDDYPVGSDIVWTRNGTHAGTVVHVSRRRIKVRNRLTGKTYWIDASDHIMTGTIVRDGRHRRRSAA